MKGARTPPALAADNVSKSFGPVAALEGVSFGAHAGRVLVLLGDNGAGKTTLIKTLCGVLQPSSGRVLMDGEEAGFRNAADARMRGIATVFQDLAVCDLMTISRNIVLGNEPTKRFGPFRIYDYRRANEITQASLETLGVRLNADFDDLAATLSGGQRQAIAIARAIHYGSRCLILDEPTAALAVRQTQQVLDLVRRAADSGQAVILITHNVLHALEVADDIIALAHGSVVGEFERGDVTMEEVARLISH